MEQVKPICVMYFPKDFSFANDSRQLEPFLLMKELNGWGNIDRHDTYEGYIWWCFTKEYITEPQLQVFHPKDFTEANYQELKQLVIDHINQTQKTENQ